MQTLRLFDPARRPTNWTEIIRPDQFAAFAKNIDAGNACDLDGRPFADDSSACCVVFDSFREAQRVSEAAVQASPGVQIDIFDGRGRANPPLVTVLHPERAACRDENPRSVRRRRVLAWALMVASLPALFLAYELNSSGQAVLPGFLGLNMLLIGGRLLWFNLGLRETERVRQERLKRLDGI